MNDSSDGEFSFLLWLLGAFVAVLAAYVSQGWVRQAQRGPTVLSQWRALLLAAGASGTGLCSAMVLGMQAAALGFPIGYQALPTAGLWLMAVLGGLAVAVWSASSLRWWSLLGSGALMAVVATALQAGWIWAAGFRPGVAWDAAWLAAAAGGLVIGLSLATWVALTEPGLPDQGSQRGRRGLLWRLGGALLAGLTVMAGQEGVMWAAGLSTQQGSVYQYEVPGAVLSVVCGVLVPLVLAAMVLDLWLRRPRRKRSTRNFNPQKQRRRRYRSRHL
jgi:NO-binding membrane sensor protein with MHYT domain